ncbi:MAG: TetR/AcrR family transcriptional regulator [Burkholderiaceae bacterium]
MATQRQIRSEQTRERLLNAAMQVLQTRGDGQLSIHEVAGAARMTTGAVQHHFGSKAALMMEVLARLLDQLGKDSDFWPPAHWGAARRADHFVRQAWSQLYGQPRFAVAWSAYLAARNDPAMTAHIAGRRLEVAGQMQARMFESFPELRSDPDGGARVQLVLSCLRGLGLQAPFAPASVIDLQLKALARTLESFLEQPESS